MAHQRRPNQKRSGTIGDALASFQDFAGIKRFTCTSCSLLCFGMAMAFSGALIGMYFKGDIVHAYWRTTGQLSSADFNQKVTSLSSPSRKNSAANESQPRHGPAAEVDWGERWLTKTVCDDSCPSGKNGKCEDGRLEAGEVLCDLGTDCTDCGSWTFDVPEANQTIPKPIELLRGRNVAVNIARTKTVPSFLMPFTDPEKDIDVSAQMHHLQVVETGLTQVWFKALSGHCTRADGVPKLVLDVGGNFGWYTFFAVSHGCRVVAWEPVPMFAAFFQFGLQVNNMTKSVRVRHKVVAEQEGKVFNMTVPFKGIWGTASIDGRNIDAYTVADQFEIVQAVSERVDGLIHEDVLIVKLDVEGYEPAAFQSMAGVFKNHKIGNFFVEYSPGVYERSSMWNEIPEMPQMLASLLDHDFTILHINDSLARGRSLLEKDDWSDDLPALEEVTEENVKYDLEDAKHLQLGTLGCHVPDELVKAYPAWRSCNALPEDLHPKGFRGTFGHNTNIWASASRASLQVGSPVGIQALDAGEKDFYGRDPEIGMGGRTCSNLGPVEVILRHRCRCNQPGCKPEADLIDSLAEQGLMSRQSVA